MDHSARGVPAAPFARVYPWAVTVLIVSLAVAAADLVWFKLHRQPPLIDFLTMWAGGGIANTDVAGARLLLQTLGAKEVCVLGDGGVTLGTWTYTAQAAS